MSEDELERAELKQKAHDYWRKENYKKCPVCGEEIGGTFDLEAEIHKGLTVQQLIDLQKRLKKEAKP